MSDLVRIADTAPIMKAVEEHLVTVDPEVAAQRAALWEGGTKADARVNAAHQALAEGRQLVNLRQALQTGANPRRNNERNGYGQMHEPGRDQRLPKLAVCRADKSEVSVRVHRNGETKLKAGRWTYEIATQPWDGEVISYSAVAAVPTVPPALRLPNMKDHLIFWEADWRRISQRNEIHINIDPALLEHVVGDLWMVVAAWELTELEIAALGG